MLQRFYGGVSPLDWMLMPESVLTAFITMMPELRAAESMQRSKEALYAQAAVHSHRLARSIWREWQSQVSGNQPTQPAAPRRQSAPQSAAEASAWFNKMFSGLEARR